jgi:hypothetical protein
VVVRVVLELVPAFLVDEKNVLFLIEELDLADLVGEVARFRTGEAEPLPGLGDVEADLHRGSPEVRIQRDEQGSLVLQRVPGAPFARRLRGVVIVVEEQRVVRVQKMHEDAVVLFDWRGIGADVEAVVDGDGAADGRSSFVGVDARRDGTALRWCVAAAAGQD